MFELAVHALLDCLGIVLLCAVLLSMVRREHGDHSHWKSAAVALGAAALALCFGNLDKIASVSVSASGFEAKTRDFQNIIDKAKATVDSLHELAVMTAELQVDMLGAQGRIGGPSPEYKDKVKARLLDHLKELGLSNDELARVNQADRTWVMYDYAFAILAPLNEANDRSKATAYAAAFQRQQPPTPEECAKLLEKFAIKNDRLDQLLADYRYYYDTGKQRRPIVWRDRGNW